jgi:hypothetical protein
MMMRFWIALAPALALALAGLPPAPAAPPSDNAALRYWVAFDRLPQLTPDQQEALDAKPPALDAIAEEIVKAAENSLHYLHRGAALPTCDWGSEMQDGPYVLLPHLAKARQLGRLACLRARVRIAAGHTAAGLDDLFDTLTLARHCGPGTMIALLVQNAIERGAIDTLASQLPKLDAATLAGLPARLDKLPAPTHVGHTLADEKRYFLTWLKAKVGDGRDDAWRKEFLGMITDEGRNEADKKLAQRMRDTIKTIRAADMVKSLDQLDTTYKEAGKLLELPPDQFAAKWPAFRTAAQANNPIAEWVLPSLGTVVTSDGWHETKRVLLRAAIAVAQNGPAALKDHRDPYGNGPFEYKALPQGFELKSKFVMDGQPATVTAGPPAK